MSEITAGACGCGCGCGSAAPRLTPEQRSSGYLLAAELLLYPAERDPGAVAEYRDSLAGWEEAAAIDAFLASPRAVDEEEYLNLLELAPPCPLYLGAYLFEEPSSCRGAGMSERNGYMLDLKASFRHFGFEPDAAEMADFVPLVAEFLSLTADRVVGDSQGVRRRLLVRLVAPALPLMRQRIERYESPYARLLTFLEHLVDDDVLASPEPEEAAGGPLIELPLADLPAFVTPGASAVHNAAKERPL